VSVVTAIGERVREIEHDASLDIAHRERNPLAVG
jgi:hypothetical protein